MIVGASLEAEGRVLERADQDGGCSAAAWAASSSTAQGLQGMLAAVQCAACESFARLQGALQPKPNLLWLIASDNVVLGMPSVLPVQTASNRGVARCLPPRGLPGALPTSSSTVTIEPAASDPVTITSPRRRN